MDIGDERAAAKRLIRYYHSRIAALESLLREWQRAPFFTDVGEWRKWRDEFSARIDETIG